MVNVEKDDREWEVMMPVRKNTHCNYLFYPANYHGCSFKGTSGDVPKCNMDTCPIKLEPNVKVIIIDKCANCPYYKPINPYLAVCRHPELIKNERLRLFVSKEEGKKIHPDCPMKIPEKIMDEEN